MILFEGEVIKGTWIAKEIIRKADNLKLPTPHFLGIR